MLDLISQIFTIKEMIISKYIYSKDEDLEQCLIFQDDIRLFIEEEINWYTTFLIIKEM